MRTRPFNLQLINGQGIRAMRVKHIEPIVGEYITVDGDEYTEYKRYDADNWSVLMGESWEPQYNCADLE